MTGILLFVFIVLGLYLLAQVIPKGNILQELGQIPTYLINVRRISLADMEATKYRFGPHWRQYLILYQPTDRSNQKNHLILYYHGGAWAFGSPEQFAANARFFTGLGYTVVMPSYRRLPLFGYKAIREDSLLALEKTVALMREKGWKDKKIILGGLSAGGNVAALLQYDREGLLGFQIPKEIFGGIMLHASPLDLKAMLFTPVLWAYAGMPHSSRFAKASPITHLGEEENTPVLLIHGTKDGLVNYRSSVNFVKRLKLVQSTGIRFHTLENGTHLDAGRWVFETNNVSARLIKQWLLELEN